MNKQVPLVSIICNTYNHEAYIRQCLDGFLMQKTDFVYEVLIHDDASTDKTADIIREYEIKYPKIIKPIYQTENQYSKGIKIQNLYQYPRVKGKYIALCEGDDYWIDPLKLQKQVDFLEQNPEYGLIHTSAKAYIQKEQHFKNKIYGSDFKEVDHLIVKNYISTLTTCFRTELYKKYIDEGIYKNEWKMGDYPLWIYMALHSKIYFLRDVTSIYRILENSASHSCDINKTIEFEKSKYEISSYFANQYNKQYLMPEIRKITFNSLIISFITFNKKVDLRICKHILLHIDWNIKTILLYIFSCISLTRKILIHHWNS